MQYLFMNNLMPSRMHITPWPQPPLASASAISPLWQCLQLLLPACSCHNSRDNMPEGPCTFTLLRCPPPTSPLFKAFVTGRSTPYGCAGFVPWPLLKPTCLQVPQKPTQYLQITFYSGIKWINSLCQVTCTTLWVHTSGTKDRGRSTICLQIQVYRLQLKINPVTI